MLCKVHVEVLNEITYRQKFPQYEIDNKVEAYRIAHQHFDILGIRCKICGLKTLKEIEIALTDIEVMCTPMNRKEPIDNRTISHIKAF